MKCKEKSGKKAGIYSASACFGRGLMYTWLLGMFRPKIVYLGKGTKEKIAAQPVIYVSNHTCHNDGQMMLTLFRGSALLMAKDWMEKGIVKWVTTGTNCIPIDRFGLDTAWLREAVTSIKAGNDVIIFPEGHTSKTGEMDEFKSGFAMLSVMTGAPVVPVYIDGEYHKLFGKRLHVYVGKPMALSEEGKGMNAEYLTRESKRFRTIINKIKGEVNHE